MAKALKHLKTLIAMQLRNVTDASFLRSRRSFIIKAVLTALQFVAVTAAFYVAFYVSILLSVFSFGGSLPDAVVCVLFTVIQIMSIFSCMTGLARSLYASKDNVILLVLPVPQSFVFLSKLAVYYLLELKRSFMLTVPLFLAYGIVSGAVWFYYPWMLFCMLLVSLLPVALGSVLSIPALYIPRLLAKVPALKYAIIALAAAAIVAGAFFLVGLIPENINLLGQWGSITQGIRSFLKGFTTVFASWNYLNLMIVGGTLAIAKNPLSLTGGLSFAVCLGVCALLIGVSFFTARLLFLKMTAKAGEAAVRGHAARPNKVRGRFLSAFSEDLTRSVRSGKAVWRSFLEFFVPAFLLFALNKIYAAMNTSLAGQTMTSAFNILVLFVTVLASNAFLAHVYSRDGAARNLVKTRPADFRLLLSARLVLRAALSTLSVLAAVLLHHFVAGASALDTACFAIASVCVNLGHIFWCAEIDVMHPEAEDAAGNSAKATACAIVLSVLFTGFYYLIAGSPYAFLKLALIAVAFCGVRAFLYFERVRLYFAEISS